MLLVVVVAFVDQSHRALVEPFHSLSVIPDAVLGVSCTGFVSAESVLLPFAPPTLVLPPICPCVDAEAAFLIRLELADVLCLVCIHVESVAMHVVFRPLAAVLSSVCPQLSAVPFEFVLIPLAVIG